MLDGLMNIIKMLRLLVVVEIAMALLTLASHWLVASRLPFELQAYLAAQVDRSWSILDWAIASVETLILIAGLISFVGLWLLRPWGRIVYTCATIAAILFLPFSDPTVNHALTNTINLIGNTSSGVILGLLWFSSLSASFERHAV